MERRSSGDDETTGAGDLWAFHGETVAALQPASFLVAASILGAGGTVGVRVA